MKLRRFNDTRVHPNTPICLIAEAGGMNVSKDVTEIRYRQYLNENNGWIEVLNNTGEYVRINRNLQIKSNISDFDRQKAIDKLKTFKKHIDYEYEI